MKKIQILTFHWTDNFGGILQAYALQECVKQLGYSVEFLNYYNNIETTAFLNWKRKLLHVLWNNIFKIILCGNRRKKITEIFRSKYLNINPVLCSNQAEIEKCSEGFYAHIVGSDQVWNADLTGNPEVYLLKNIQNSSRKIAYGASFGKKSLNSKYNVLYSSELKKFHKISVREIDGADIVQNVSGLNAEVVLDPVFLLSRENWAKIAVPINIKHKYILCYYMPSKDTVTIDAIKKLSYIISQSTGYKIINIGKKEYEKLKPWENNVFDIGPENFLSLIMNAECVITNSFHGTAFSLKMNIPFFVPINYQIPEDIRLSSRIEWLLKNFKCEDHIIECPLNLNEEKFNLEKLNFDFSFSNSLLEKQVVQSMNFLSNSLK